MPIVPRYNLDPGTGIKLYSEEMALRRTTLEGYEFQSAETGDISVVGFSQFVELLKSPAMKLGLSNRIEAKFVQLRLKGFIVAEQLSDAQQDLGAFHWALCTAIASIEPILKTQVRLYKGEVPASAYETPKVQKMLCGIASELFGKKIRVASQKGGKNQQWLLYQGRTLLKYYDIYKMLSPEDDHIAALTVLDHLKGNETSRFPYRLRQLMIEAWEEIGLDLKETSTANVHRHVKALVKRENKQRTLNGLEELIVPSEKSLIAHRNHMVTPLQYAIATKGERWSRNKHGKSSTDIRALMVGELVEMDEYKMSLVISAKERGYWHTLSIEVQAVLEEIDREIRERFVLLVMIDVASRMPLAWIISDQPRAEATLALLRMATRDKAREKIIYGCEGETAPPMGLGMIKNDNGTGLRNVAVKKAVIGIRSTSVDVRTNAPTDKHMVERLLGTTESVLMKIVHGYTGRKPGDLPGYDSVKNGVLKIEDLSKIINQFFIDEYPSMQHWGVGMGGRRPVEVMKELNETRKTFKCLDPDIRRVHLAFKEVVTPNDQGVMVYKTLWYNSTELQEELDVWFDGNKKPKVSVFVDPDDLHYATVVVPGNEKLFRVALQTTFFADMTLVEVANLLEMYRYEHPEVTEMHEDRLLRVYEERHAELNRIAVEHNLPRSYSTQEELRKKLKTVTAGARVVLERNQTGTLDPDNLLEEGRHEGVFNLDDDGSFDDSTVVALDDDASSSSHEDSTQEAQKRVNDGGHEGASNATEETEAMQTAERGDYRPLGRPQFQGKLK